MAQPKSAAATPNAERDSLKGQAWTVASRRLREDDREKWLRFLHEEYDERGLEWSPRPTAEEKAEEQLTALMAEYPDLAAQVAQRAKDTE